jgi:phosphatidylserine/phosphatidylglycerophosphate/cardiolipin synthase-like enzyme
MSIPASFTEEAQPSILIDPLSDDPVVITGSANFSKNSKTNNDENMLIVRGKTRLADIFLGEFIRRKSQEVGALSRLSSSKRLPPGANTGAIHFRSRWTVPGMPGRRVQRIDARA